MSDPSTTAHEPKIYDLLIDEIAEQMSVLDSWVNDSVDVEMLLDIRSKVKPLYDILNIITGHVDASLRANVARGEGVVFLKDGHTLVVETEPKRVLTSTGRRLIHDRIVRRSLAAGQGEAEAAIRAAIAETEALYLAPSAMPKSTQLKALGLKMADVAEEEQTDKPGKLVIQ